MYKAMVPAQSPVELHMRVYVTLSDSVFNFYGLVPILQIRRKTNLSLISYFISIIKSIC